jgi:hypothetical protein
VLVLLADTCVWMWRRAGMARPKRSAVGGLTAALAQRAFSITFISYHEALIRASQPSSEPQHDEISALPLFTRTAGCAIDRIHCNWINPI